MTEALTASQIWAGFKRQLELRLAPFEHRDAVGASNGPIVLSNAFRFGLFNLDGIVRPDSRAIVDGLVLRTRIVLPPGRVLCLALEYRDNAAVGVKERIDQIRDAVGDASKARVYLHRRGTYFRQARDQERVELADPTYGDPVVPSGFWYVETAPGADAPSDSSIAREYVAWLEDIHPVRPPAPLGTVAVQGGGSIVIAEGSEWDTALEWVRSIPDGLLWDTIWTVDGPLVVVNQGHPLIGAVSRSTGAAQSVLLRILYELGREELLAFNEGRRSTMEELRLQLSYRLRQWADSRGG